MLRDRIGPDTIAAIMPVSRETQDRLSRLVALVETWQRAENLVAPSTLPNIWLRHIADSAQLVPAFPDAVRWLDLGSGGGFPGLVVAILIRERPGASVHLVESNGRKCAFLRTAIRETAAPATVHQGRIGDILADWREPVDAISARALAPLPDLLTMTAGLIQPHRPGAFMKGADYRAEVEAAARDWDIDYVATPSRVAEGSVILEVTRAVRIQRGNGART